MAARFDPDALPHADRQGKTLLGVLNRDATGQNCQPGAIWLVSEAKEERNLAPTRTWQHAKCRGAELNCLRRPFQGRALPVSYPGTE